MPLWTLKIEKEEIQMRNLKRALSLALAAIMLLGMMVVGAGAVNLDEFFCCELQRFLRSD